MFYLFVSNGSWHKQILLAALSPVMFKVYHVKIFIYYVHLKLLLVLLSYLITFNPSPVSKPGLRRLIEVGILQPTTSSSTIISLF